MPVLNFQIAPEGPIIDVLIGVSQPRANALQLAKFPVPPPIQVRMLIDTGASATCVQSGLLQPLGLVPSGQITVQTPFTTAQWHQYDVSVTLLHPLYPYTLFTVPVVECQPLGGTVQGLLGRDVLAHCLLVYLGQPGIFSLAF